jgi:hypothetical protein
MARAEPTSQHGWFPDPEDPERLRMWDGKGWTSLTKYPARDEAVATRPTPSGPMPQKPQPSAADTTAASHRPRPGTPAATVTPRRASQDASFVAGNFYSLITLGVAIVYIVLASAVGWVFIGVLPVLLAVHTFRVREPMAPFAALGAAAAVVIGLVLLAR